MEELGEKSREHRNGREGRENGSGVVIIYIKYTITFLVNFKSQKKKIMLLSDGWNLCKTTAFAVCRLVDGTFDALRPK